MKLLLLAALVAVALAHPVEVSENDLNEWENFKVRDCSIKKYYSAVWFSLFLTVYMIIQEKVYR